MTWLRCFCEGDEGWAKHWDDHPAHEDWDVIKDLGSGSFSKVVLCRHKREKIYAALKVVFLDSPGLDGETKAMLSVEGKLLLSLDHPNIVKCSEILESPKALVFVLEYLGGCNVLDGIYHLRNGYSERDAAGIFKQLAMAVEYLHSCSILHRDIKPENLVYQKRPEKRSNEKGEVGPVVKLVDLGLAVQISENVHEKGVLGSAGFVAPEIVKGHDHTPAMDVFGMGVLLFVMMVGRKPWDVEQCEKLRYTKMNLADAPGFKDPRWLDLSPDAKHLIVGMLQFDPKKRFTAQQVLHHEWVTSMGGLTVRILGENVALGAATVAEMRRLKFLCHGVVALNKATSKKTTKKDREELAKMTQDVYLKRVALTQRREASVRGGNRWAKSAARSIAARSFAMVHDSGRSVHEGVLQGSIHYNGLHESIHGGKQGIGSSTSLILSELFLSEIYDGSSSRNSGKLSSIKMLGASVKHFMDESVHGGRKGSVKYNSEWVHDDEQEEDSNSNSNMSSHPWKRKVNSLKPL
eukprot:jgi/Picsp_1/5161/NSC_02524-R1_calcium calmodulin-dependent protein kinase type iv-like